MSFSQKILKFFFLLAFLFSASCMRFSSTTLPEIKPQPPKNKPTIGMKVGNFKQYYNKKTDTRGIISNKSMGLNCLKGILEPWKNRDLIKDYNTMDKFKKLPDYTMTINGKLHQDTSPTLNFFSVLTLFIIPSYNTTTFDLDFDLQNNRNGKFHEAELNISFTIWKDLIFIPMFPFFSSDMDTGRTSKSMYLYNQFQKQRAFQQ